MKFFKVMKNRKALGFSVWSVISLFLFIPQEIYPVMDFLETGRNRGNIVYGVRH